MPGAVLYKLSTGTNSFTYHNNPWRQALLSFLIILQICTERLVTCKCTQLESNRARIIMGGVAPESTLLTKILCCLSTLCPDLLATFVLHRDRMGCIYFMSCLLPLTLMIKLSLTLPTSLAFTTLHLQFSL